MKLLQILQKCLEDWKNISHLDFCLVNLDNTIYISTCDRALPSEEKLEEFKEDEALCISNMNCRLYKVTECECTPGHLASPSHRRRTRFVCTHTLSKLYYFSTKGAHL